jgi:hypothetical protein
MNAPRKLNAAVDVQLDDFELELFNALEFQLIVNTNRTFWEDEDHLSNECLMGIEEAVDWGFDDDIAKRYDGTEVIMILDMARVVIYNAVFAAMNVPYPRNPDRHIERVLDNIGEIYVDVVYPQLRTEMLMMNHHAQILQRSWRRCITDPNHPACRRRLEYEYQDLMNISV